MILKGLKARACW